MNVFDFDKTIYDGDSTVDFCLYLMGRYPAVIGDFISNLGVVIRYKAGKITKTQMKESLYKCLRRVPDMEKELARFWDRHMKNVEKWYLDIQREDDVIISASPEFLLAPICAELGVECMMATRVDKKTGLFDGENCHGKQKVTRFYEQYPNAEIDNFYSDMYCDTPLALISKQAFIVKGEKLSPWKFKKKDII